MSADKNTAGYDNPFATRYVRPGAIDFEFAEDEDLDTLIDRLQQAGWWGQIVGPHGSGKSTLLAALAPRLEARGRRLVRRTLHAGQRTVRLTAEETCARDAAALVIVDGYEQLSWLARWRLRRRCRRAQSGLLVTAHRSVGLTTIFRTTVTPELAQRVVSKFAGERFGPGQGFDLGELVRRRRGNLRDVLFDLYDLYELHGA